VSEAACFTYGSLMWADILGRVIGRPAPAGEPARLHGHARHPVRGQDYPGLVAAPGATVAGRLYRGITPADWARLDAYEGDDYERVAVQVALPGGGQQAAWVYRHRRPEALADGDWSEADFEREGRARFMAQYPGFADLPRD
jgi:gamma-glutamylcyclotransferase (GGCT)/AIG2-like uncharacterized protein YtfP